MRKNQSGGAGTFLAQRDSMLFPWHLRGTQRILIDIGSSSVKLAAAASGRQGPTISRLTTVPLGPGTFQNGWIADSGAVTEAIEGFARAERLQGAEAVTAVPGRSVLIKILELPARDGKELDTAIEFEAMQVIPANLSNVFLDYQAIETRESEGKAAVLLTAAKKELVRSYMEVLSGAGLTPAVIDVDCFALHNLCRALYPDTAHQTVCVINAGASVTTLNVSRSQGAIFLSTELETAGQLFTETLASELGIPVEEAEAMKRRYRAERKPSHVARVIHSVCRKLGDELDRELNRFATLIGSHAIDRLFLCGGTSRLDGLHQMLLEHSHQRVTRFEPLLPDSMPLAGDTSTLPPEFAVIAGLALRWP